MDNRNDGAGLPVRRLHAREAMARYLRYLKQPDRAGAARDTRFGECSTFARRSRAAPCPPYED